ncbi:MAG: hypothetical protein A3C90_04775 [Candidatus Magasanikbacteria bacterium RIFCSPHIGHO2_02_FULL_51_14]|uniref:Cytidyltransferase-like domain-containing protein n=1 Tax=Candidatus Magasanikbacteria bacterium RIFCSPHIGHO2_02_FULL_51_14 TaxID=1798683 RepID=A0A1F6MDE5_9BACT|nr:MAG: hypothetical protein A3C90_04775 [Candidatus Magasanikbacteria bacterium RIFCSPHIGHO2_02_FULL_51_14]
MKTVLVFGTFDFLHIGHISFLKKAKSLGDRLVVVITRDRIVKRLKGRPPIHSERERKTIIEHVDIVDSAVLGDATLSRYAVLKRLRPDILALGYDQIELKADILAFFHKHDMHMQMATIPPYNPDGRKSSKIKKALAL